VPRAPRGATRIGSRRVSFDGLDELPDAVDELAADLDAQWRAAGVVPPQTAPPLRVAAALSSSRQAVAGYLQALEALRAGDAPGARRGLDAALNEDRAFALAALQKAFLDLTEGTVPAPCSATRAPLLDRACEGIRRLAEGDAARALQSGERLAQEQPHAAWGAIVRGLALVRLGRRAEALPDWRRAAALDLLDPRPQLWLGRSLMATGDFAGAAAALAAARRGIPSLLRAHVLHAEALARQRDTAGAAAVLNDLRARMEAAGSIPPSDSLNPYLMLGAVQLMEGKFQGALAAFEDAVKRLAAAGAPIDATRTLYVTIAEMRRDLVVSRDPLLRERQLEEAEQALADLERALPPREREAAPWVAQRLKGLIWLRRNMPVEAWKVVEDLRSHAGKPGYTGYEDAYLSAAIMLKEGDAEGALAQFQRVVQARGKMVDVMDLAQVQFRMNLREPARANLAEFEERLSRYDPGPEEEGEMVLTNPHLSLLVPIYHFTRGQFSYTVGDAADSRRHYGRMLSYFREPDEQFMAFVKEATGRGAQPE
ncbi:MAG TPA: hypothetical protein VJV23_14625, partial [Candidatus Polarisedimenticolia bacterium]|nr:hypothetical protein [Candidatus Polarisedimenticolia bacterium]